MHPSGTGLLEIARGGGGSVVRRAFASSPLRLLTPRNHGRAAWAYAGSYGGGLVGGDALRLTVRVGPGAAAFVSTQASTKIYRSAAGASVETDASVGPDALLVAWPDPVVCFAGSHYRQRQHVDVARGGALVLVDWMTSGRRASGERWQFDRYASRLTVKYDGRLVLLDALCLSQTDGDLPARMGRWDVLGAAVLVGPGLADDGARILAGAAGTPWARRPDVLAAAAPLDGAGCILRVAGPSVEAVGRVLHGHLGFVARALGDDPWARKW